MSLLFSPNAYLKIVSIHHHLLTCLFMQLPAYSISLRDTQKVVDNTYYTPGSELTWEEKKSLVTFVNDAMSFKIIHEARQIFEEYVPLVHELRGGCRCHQRSPQEHPESQTYVVGVPALSTPPASTAKEATATIEAVASPA